MQNNYSKKHKPGFTLLELLVVLGILFVIFAFGYPSYSNIREDVVLKDTSYEIVNVLRLAQDHSISSMGASPWGVDFATDSYILRGSDYSHEYDLPSGISITADSSSQITFDRLTGSANVGMIKLVSSGGKQRNITVDSLGKVFNYEL